MKVLVSTIVIVAAAASVATVGRGPQLSRQFAKIENRSSENKSSVSVPKDRINDNKKGLGRV
jgi:hypothetical protein